MEGIQILCQVCAIGGLLIHATNRMYHMLWTFLQDVSGADASGGPSGQVHVSLCRSLHVGGRRAAQQDHGGELVSEWHLLFDAAVEVDPRVQTGHGVGTSCKHFWRLANCRLGNLNT